MKKKGSYFEYEQERNADLMRAYHEYVARCKVIRVDEMCEHIASMPSSRFWVSEERAAIIISRMMKGDKLHDMRPLKRKMFLEIYRRVMALRKTFPNASVYNLCFKAVNSPAPEFYMTQKSIREIIYRIKRKWYERKR